MEVLDYLKSEHSYGNKDSRMGKALEKRFGGTPYGWERDMLRLILATLFRAGEIEVINASQSTDKRDALRNISSKSSSEMVGKRQFELLSGNAEFDFTARARSKSLRPFKEFGYEVRQGLATGDNFRFLRLRWEIPQSLLNDRWRTYSKGGDAAARGATSRVTVH